MRMTFLFAAAALTSGIAHALNQYETQVEGVDEAGQAVVIKTDATASASPDSAAPTAPASAPVVVVAPAPEASASPPAIEPASTVVIITEDSSQAPVAEPAPAVDVPAKLPAKGSGKSDVERGYGKPMVKHAAVGGSSREQPPITRWDYPGFSVFFEYDHVVDAVLRNNPAPVQVYDGLAGAPK